MPVRRPLLARCEVRRGRDLAAALELHRPSIPECDVRNHAGKERDSAEIGAAAARSIPIHWLATIQTRTASSAEFTKATVAGTVMSTWRPMPPP